MGRVKILISSLLILLMSVVAVSAALSYYYYPPAYGGQSAYYRRHYYSPASQKLYFGQAYGKPLGGFGSKGTWSSYSRVSGGLKSPTSPSSNLATNSFTPMGRNPNVVSNWDPNFRGYNRIDTSVVLEPYNLGFQIRQGLRVFPRGSARLISQFGNFGSGARSSPWQSNNKAPQSEIYVQARDLPPLGNAERYELWLFDSDFGRKQSLGLIYGGLGGTIRDKVQISKPIQQFDFVGISREPYPDLDPTPNRIVLIGAINPARQKEVEAFVRTLK
ncbi:hypothetical protein DRJ25_00535 [Candidatus Woesearchaeota archaeon]|nr:MAG: hypothetical protein DRJ25_00535 [Candidatus Woesearchaeota archaeon]